MPDEKTTSNQGTGFSKSLPVTDQTTTPMPHTRPPARPLESEDARRLRFLRLTVAQRLDLQEARFGRLRRQEELIRRRADQTTTPAAIAQRLEAIQREIQVVEGQLRELGIVWQQLYS